MQGMFSIRFCTTVLFCITVPFLYHCSVFALLFRFFSYATTEQCVFVKCSVFSNCTMEQKWSKNGTVCFRITVPFLHWCSVSYHCSVFALLFRFLYHCSVFSQGTAEQKRNSVVLYHCSVYFHKEQWNKNGTVWYCITVPFFFHNGTKTEQCGIVSLFRFFHMELRNSFVYAPLFRFLHYCSVFIPLFRFCITVPFLQHCSVFSQGTTEQKWNSVVLYHCSVFALLFRFYTTVPFLHYCSVF